MPPIKHLLAWALLISWLGSAWAGLWSFRDRFQVPFATDFSFVDKVQKPGVLKLPEGTQSGQTITWLHFWNPDCRCSRLGLAHVRQLRQNFPDTKVRLVVVVPPSSPNQLDSEDVNQLFGHPVELIRSSDLVPDSWPASPSALIIDAQRRLTYLGPYSEGLACLTTESPIVARALQKALHSDATAQINVLGEGCYCPWPSST